MLKHICIEAHTPTIFKVHLENKCDLINGKNSFVKIIILLEKFSYENIK